MNSMVSDHSANWAGVDVQSIMARTMQELSGWIYNFTVACSAEPAVAPDT
jgi:hypothetical protein